MPGGLTIDTVLSMSQPELAETIKPVSFYRVKASNILKTCAILKDEFNGDIPDTVQNLVMLPGIGYKMAFLIMMCAWGKCEGIVVDTHVHRICNRLMWAKTWPKRSEKGGDPQETRVVVESWLPKEYWADLNRLMVGFGQTICTPVRPKCEECLLNDICPSSKHKPRFK